jgi:Mitochondrial carrier protein
MQNNKMWNTQNSTSQFDPLFILPSLPFHLSPLPSSSSLLSPHFHPSSLLLTFLHPQEGATAFWKGIGPAWLREASYTSLRLGLYSPIKHLLGMYWKV